MLSGLPQAGHAFDPLISWTCAKSVFSFLLASLASPCSLRPCHVGKVTTGHRLYRRTAQLGGDPGDVAMRTGTTALAERSGGGITAASRLSRHV